MKTTKFIPVLSLALILATAVAAYSIKPTTDKTQKVSRSIIRYEVTVKLPADASFCNTYVVQVSDERGNPVAHPQVYVPGINLYVFNEPVTSLANVRIATFEILQDFSILGCPINVITKPDIRQGPFFPYETYTFILRPMILTVDTR